MRLILQAAVAAGLAALTIQPLHAADLGGNCCADLEDRVAELEATTARKGNTKVSVSISGHVNEAVLWSDGGDADIINNDNSSSRFRIKGSSKVNEEWSAGFLMEFGVDHDGADPLNIRHQAIYLKSKQLGTFWLGHTSVATDGITEIDLSSANVASTVLGQTLEGGNVFDGGRSDVIRWISPTMGGFTASASWSDDETFGAAIHFGRNFDAIALQAGVGYLEIAGGDHVISGSISIKHVTSGVFITAAGGQIEDGAEQWGVRGGIDTKLVEIGKTTLYAEYSEVIDGLSYFGVGAVQSIDAAAMDMYIAYRDRDDDTEQFVIGAKIKF